MKKDPVTLAVGDIRWETTLAGVSLGGSAAVFAARLSALGRKVRCAGILGADKRGDAALAELASWHVDAELVQRHPSEVTEEAQLEIRSDGTSVVRSHTRGAAANLAWTPELQDAADEVDILFWSSETQRDPISAATFKKFIDGCPPSFKVFDIDCAAGVPTQAELEAGLAVASVAHIRGRDLAIVCRVLGLPDLEPGLLAPALTERYGVSYAVLADPLQGALISSIVGEQVGMELTRESAGDLLGWHEAFLAGFVYHVFLGSSLARCCGAATQYAQAVGATNGAVSRISNLEIESVKIGG
jgi:sugar/nucleoside kinase (ribokinase family)